MIKITQVLISPEAREYLIKRQLDKQYHKAKIFILAGHHCKIIFRFNNMKTVTSLHPWIDYTLTLSFSDNKK